VESRVLRQGQVEKLAELARVERGEVLLVPREVVGRSRQAQVARAEPREQARELAEAAVVAALR
jgi:hypothetical protein